MQNGRIWRLTRRYSMFLICFVSYFALLLFSVLFSIYNYTTFWNELKNQRLQYDQIIFRQLDEMIYAKVGRVNSLLLDIITDVDILRTTSTTDLVEREQLPRTLTAAVRLRNYYNKAQIAKAYLYYRDADAIIMDESYYRPEEFYARYIDKEKLTFDQWKDILGQQKNRSFERAPTSGSENLVMYHSISNGRNRGAQVAIEFGMEDVYRSFRSSLAPESTFFSLMDAAGTCLFSYGAGDMENTGGHYLEPYVSEYTGWTYLSAMPANLYYRGLNEMVQRTVAMVGVELLLGVSICLLFARSNSMPIRKLYGRLLNTSKKKPDARNEYYLVNTCFEELLEEKDNLVRQYRQAMKNNLLQSMLSGTLSLREAEDSYLGEMGIRFSGSDFQAVSVQIEYAEVAENLQLERQSLIKFHFISQLTERLGQMAALFYVDLSWNQMALILNGNGLEDRQDALYYLLDDMKNGFEKSFQTYLTVGIGGIQTNAERVFLSHEESVAALEYKMLRGRSSVTTYRDVCTNVSGSYYPAINRVQIKAKIRSGDAEGAIGALDQIFDDILSNSAEIPLEVVKCIFFHIMSIGLDVLSEIRLDVPAVSGYQAMLVECKTIDGLHLRMQTIFSEICTLVAKRKRSHGQRLFDRICEYMEQHYMEQTFSLVMLADHLEITAPYLSSFFKEQTGTNFVDYLTDLRLGKARDLIVGTNMSIADIAVNVGYSGSGSFIRAFKKAEGVTPALYRQQDVPVQST